MSIDIRESSHQLECTHCAECIDACSGILGKLGRQSLVTYAWGDAAGHVQKETAWYRRIGFRDGKRIAILVLLAVYASGLSVVISLRKPVMVRVMPDRITLYTLAPDGQVHNTFRVVASNRSHTTKQLILALDGIPQGRIANAGQPIVLAPGQSLQSEFEVAAPLSALQPGINRMRIIASVPEQKPAAFEETFFVPTKSSSPVPKANSTGPSEKNP